MLTVSGIVYLFAVSIVAIGVHEEIFFGASTPESGYDYVNESCFNLTPSRMMEMSMQPQTGKDAPFRARFMNNNEAMYTYEPAHEYRSKWHQSIISS